MQARQSVSNADFPTSADKRNLDTLDQSRYQGVILQFACMMEPWSSRMLQPTGLAQGTCIKVQAPSATQLGFDKHHTAGNMAPSQEGCTPQPQYTAHELVKLWNEYMIEGARYGDEEDVHEALKNSAEVDAQDEDGRTALHMAAANAYTTIAQTLLQAGANTEIKNQSGNTALHWACVAGSAPMVELLLAQGANPAVLNAAGQPPIDGALDNEAVCKVFQLHSSKHGGGELGDDTEMTAADATVDIAAGAGSDSRGSSDLADGVAHVLNGVQLK